MSSAARPVRFRALFFCAARILTSTPPYTMLAAARRSFPVSSHLLHAKTATSRRHLWGFLRGRSSVPRSSVPGGTHATPVHQSADPDGLDPVLCLERLLRRPAAARAKASRTCRLHDVDNR